MNRPSAHQEKTLLAIWNIFTIVMLLHIAQVVHNRTVIGIYKAVILEISAVERDWGAGGGGGVFSVAHMHRRELVMFETRSRSSTRVRRLSLHMFKS